MKENTRRLIDYSLPAVFENILQTSVGFVDSILIAKISLVAVSAVSLVNGVMAVYQAVFIALAVAVATVVSNAAGARSGTDISENVRQSIALSLLIGVSLSVLSLILAHPILRAMGASGAILQQGVIFFSSDCRHQRPHCLDDRPWSADSDCRSNQNAVNHQPHGQSFKLLPRCRPYFRFIWLAKTWDSGRWDWHRPFKIDWRCPPFSKVTKNDPSSARANHQLATAPF